MIKLCCALIISLNGRKAHTDGDEASNQKIDFCLLYLEILNLEKHTNHIICSKFTAILLSLSEWFVACPV